MQYEDYFGYPIYYNETTGLSTQCCFTSRIVLASGDPLTEVENSAPDEASWILGFKFNHAYEVLNGWKRWANNNATEFWDGADGVPFQLFLECASAICEESIAAAASLVASAFAVSALFVI